MAKSVVTNGGIDRKMATTVYEREIDSDDVKWFPSGDEADLQSA